MKPSFLPRLKVIVGLDNTLFVNASIKDLVITFSQAMILLVLIILIFLQDC
ncbi:hypothetical protein [cyanobacterium endosymbiont of Rhopalodia gibberula]|uniref:hypothetical protein n=1 Tax=cyanobacterium endosymbiont of Rhopalodia gibberula TaxID=1763363 RepID=UPI001559F388